MNRWRTTLTPSALERLVAAARQRLPGLEVEAPEPIGEGISTLTYGLRSPEGRWVLRVSRRHPEPWTWRGGRRGEVALLAELGRRGLPVPGGAVVIEQVDGLPTAILERRIEGTPLRPEQIGSDPRLIARIAAVLDVLHGVEDEAPVVRELPRDDPGAELRQALAAVDLGDRQLRRRVEDMISTLEQRASIRTLCHRDFRAEHLIIGPEGELAGLLDFGEVGVDDPAVDLAFLHGELGAGAVAAICARMATADPELAAAARTIHSLWPLLELAPGGETWGDPATARSRLAALM